MSNIDRAYCVISLVKETGVFLDILTVKPTLEEALAYRDAYPQNPDYTYLVWAVVNE